MKNTTKMALGGFLFGFALTAPVLAASIVHYVSYTPSPEIIQANKEYEEANKKFEVFMEDLDTWYVMEYKTDF